jgi:mRNA-degrading endonuclease toxin of MazEF toxin-antitoxin module
MTLSKGDIVLTQFPFTDLSQTKLRPAVILWVDLAKDEITLCFISSQKFKRRPLLVVCCICVVSFGRCQVSASAKLNRAPYFFGQPRFLFDSSTGGDW